MRGGTSIGCFLLSILFTSCFSKQRSGEEIYTTFFGKTSDNCLKLLESRDTRAIDDCCVWIHFKACPSETKRVLSLVPYQVKTMTKRLMEIEFPDPSSIDENMISTDPPKWWILRKLGDSCLKFEYFHPDKDYAQFAYVSIDSTEIFYHDSSW